MSAGRRSGPGPKSETAQDEVAAAVLTIVPAPTDIDQSAEIAAVSFVALVETRDGRTRRHSYFSLNAAQKAVERAHNRGVAARVVLCHLVPVREVNVTAEARR